MGTFKNYAFSQCFKGKEMTDQLLLTLIINLSLMWLRTQTTAVTHFTCFIYVLILHHLFLLIRSHSLKSSYPPLWRCMYNLNNAVEQFELVYKS